jgi:hypothetical protein
MRLYYAVDFLDVICQEDFDTEVDMKKWILEHPQCEIIDIQKDYAIKD